MGDRRRLPSAPRRGPAVDVERGRAPCERTSWLPLRRGRAGRRTPTAARPAGRRRPRPGDPHRQRAGRPRSRGRPGSRWRHGAGGGRRGHPVDAEVDATPGSTSAGSGSSGGGGDRATPLDRRTGEVPLAVTSEGDRPSPSAPPPPMWGTSSPTRSPSASARTGGDGVARRRPPPARGWSTVDGLRHRGLHPLALLRPEIGRPRCPGRRRTPATPGRSDRRRGGSTAEKVPGAVVPSTSSMTSSAALGLTRPSPKLEARASGRAKRRSRFSSSSWRPRRPARTAGAVSTTSRRCPPASPPTRRTSTGRRTVSRDPQAVEASLGEPDGVGLRRVDGGTVVPAARPRSRRRCGGGTAPPVRRASSESGRRSTHRVATVEAEPHLGEHRSRGPSCGCTSDVIRSVSTGSSDDDQALAGRVGPPTRQAVRVSPSKAPCWAVGRGAYHRPWRRPGLRAARPPSGRRRRPGKRSRRKS